MPMNKGYSKKAMGKPMKSAMMVVVKPVKAPKKKK
jgi:hypothetical protein